MFQFSRQLTAISNALIIAPTANTVKGEFQSQVIDISWQAAVGHILTF